MLKIDLHVHTCYSYDAITTLKEVIAFSRKQGLDGIAVTDHDTLSGALQLIKNKDFIVIPGVEISTRRGHILALNVTTPIPSKLSPFETIQRIHEAGGIAVAPHPSTVYKARMNFPEDSALKFDAIEVVNSAAFPFFLATRLNQRLAARLNLPQTAGSDSHTPWTIGLAYTIVHAEPDVEEIVQSIKLGTIDPKGKAITWFMRLQKAFLGYKKSDCSKFSS